MSTAGTVHDEMLGLRIGTMTSVTSKSSVDQARTSSPMFPPTAAGGIRVKRELVQQTSDSEEPY